MNSLALPFLPPCAMKVVCTVSNAFPPPRPKAAFTPPLPRSPFFPWPKRSNFRSARMKYASKSVAQAVLVDKGSTPPIPPYKSCIFPRASLSVAKTAARKSKTVRRPCASLPPAFWRRNARRSAARSRLLVANRSDQANEMKKSVPTTFLKIA